MSECNQAACWLVLGEWNDDWQVISPSLSYVAADWSFPVLRGRWLVLVNAIKWLLIRPCDLISQWSSIPMIHEILTMDGNPEPLFSVKENDFLTCDKAIYLPYLSLGLSSL